MIDEIEITEFFDSGFIGFEWSDNINGWMVGAIFSGEIELFGNFF